MASVTSPLSQSVAIILGASEWPHHPGFSASSAFKNSANFFMDYLAENGVKASNILDLFDSDRLPAELISKIDLFLTKRLTPDKVNLKNVMVYYVGHGNLVQQQYFLATRCTTERNLELTTLPAKQIAGTLARCASDKRQIIVLDACYAAAANTSFITQSFGIDLTASIARDIREELPDTSITRGTTLFCAAGPKIPARTPLGGEYTMFSGALSRVLSAGDAHGEELLTIQRVAELVEKEIHATYSKEGVRPELHTPRQEKGDIRSLPFFPNHAWRERPQESFERNRADIRAIKGLVFPLNRELEWENESRKQGWYRLLEKHLIIDEWGDAVMTHRVVGVSGADDNQICALPLHYECQPNFGICIVDSVEDHERDWKYSAEELPKPSCDIRAELQLKPPATWDCPHKGFTVKSSLINSYAVTNHDAKLRRQDEEEFSSIKPRYPVQCLRMIVTFPKRFLPSENPQLLACHDESLDRPIRDWSDVAAETARIRSFLFYNQELNVAVFQLERVLPHYQYVLRWKLPKIAGAASRDAPDAREQVGVLLGFGQTQREEMARQLTVIRDAVCERHLSRHKRNWSNVNLSVAVYDEDAGNTKVVCSTNPIPAGQSFGWGAGVVGSVMKRRSPVFVDTEERWMRGLYGSEDRPAERHLICVPLALPTWSEQRNEALNCLQTPCAVGTLSCCDKNGQLDRVKSEGNEDSGKLLADLSSDIADGLLDMIGRTMPTNH